MSNEEEIANQIHLLVEDVNKNLVSVFMKHAANIVDVHNKVGGTQPIFIKNLNSEEDPVEYLKTVLPTLVEINNALMCFAKQIGIKINTIDETRQNVIKFEKPKDRDEKKGIKHWTSGAAKAIKAMTLSETDESKARLAVCHGCDKWTGTSCKVCGCFVNLKVKMPEEKCPEGKW